MVNIPIDYEYRKQLKQLSPYLANAIKSREDLNKFQEKLNILLKQTKRSLGKDDKNLRLAVIITQLKIWDPSDREFLLGLYNFNDIDEDCYDYRRGLKVAMKVKTSKDFLDLKEMLNVNTVKYNK